MQRDIPSDLTSRSFNFLFIPLFSFSFLSFFHLSFSLSPSLLSLLSSLMAFLPPSFPPFLLPSFLVSSSFPSSPHLSFLSLKPGKFHSEESVCSVGLISGSGRSPGEGNGCPFQCSFLGNPMDRGAWKATVHGVAKSWKGLRD